MSDEQSPILTPETLRDYSEASLSNAEELLTEASILLEKGHFARAYFLAVSSIEEVGKGLLSFDSQNRNLADPAVVNRLRTSSASHDAKINHALGAWAMRSADPRAAIQAAVDLIIALRHGRQPSMYTDLNEKLTKVLVPREVVHDRAAKDCVRLAGDCLSSARAQLSEDKPKDHSPAADRIFAMKPKKFQEMLSQEDFWWYLISEMEGGQLDFPKVADEYERTYARAGKVFRPIDGPDR